MPTTYYIASAVCLVSKAEPQRDVLNAAHGVLSTFLLTAVPLLAQQYTFRAVIIKGRTMQQDIVDNDRDWSHCINWQCQLR